MKKILVSIVIIFIIHVSAKAQDTTDYFYYTFDSTGQVINTFDTLYYLNCHLHILDTTNITGIQVDVGSQKGTDDVFTYYFDYINPGTLPQDMSFTKNGNNIQICLGIFVSGFYYFNIRYNRNGVWSEPLLMNFEE